MRGLSMSLIFFGYWSIFITLLLRSIHTGVVAQNSQNTTVLPVGSCTPDIPCSNGACCNGASGFCGFGSKFCGSDVCTSNCDALAECGPDAAPENITCPLNVCCSQFGFCGTTEDFCGEGCKSNCGSPKIPLCGVNASTATHRRIAYYEGWAATRSCMAFTPEKIPADALTHINYAFALISPSFKIIEMTAGDSALWRRTTALKKNRPGLKVFLSIGGWTFNDPPNQHIFSNLAASTTNINTFIASALSIMEQYAFDGLDIDWEYPVAWDRGGVPADKANYVTFMKAVKGAFSSKNYGLTFTAPSSFWYLQHFNLPGLLKYADWVNVMTYDLHGVWDGVDPYIGYHVLGHTNLIEIDEAFKLYWRVGVDSSQMVMGMAFYGRSYTLSSAECTDPGCPWTSGGDKGPCSNNAGSLMWAEIDAIVGPSKDAVLQTDDEAAVNYAVWDKNQWVSYDDVETFQKKMDYANDRCIGGTMIWSIDQDDKIFSRLESLYPDIAFTDLQGGDGGEENDGTCFVSDCGSTCYDDVQLSANSIHASYIVGEVFYNPITGNCKEIKEGKGGSVCCPTNMGGSCTKRGYKDATTSCNPQCEMDEILVALDVVGNDLDQVCSSGNTGLCCAGGLTVAPADCTFSPCNTTPETSCPSDSPNYVTSLALPGGACTDGKKQGYCCEKPLPWINCKWRGVPPLCGGNSCDIGQITMFQDPIGDADTACTGGNMRSYCCDVPQALPVPFSDIFPDNVKDSGNDLFTVEFDPDEGDPKFSEDGSKSTFTEDDNENNGAFGEVFIDSPNPSSVSSVDLSSDWVVTSCDPRSDQPQTVLAYCSKANSDGCQHVFIGGAEHTIVKLPTSCGLGPYARIASFEVHEDQDSLSASHSPRKPTSESVYQLSFDYNFAAIPASNGPVYMRADVTDMPGYWDSVVDSPPERREWLQKRGLWKEPPKKRWWGSFKTWLSKLNTVEKSNTQSRTFYWSNTWTIFHQDLHCDGPPIFDASLDISVTGSSQLTTRYGFYLQGQVVPPSVTAAYVFFNSGGNAAATFTMTGTASATYNSDTVELARFGFPGLYYPGLLTIGPSLALNGYITGHLSLQGTLTTGLTYQFPELHYALGKSGDDDTGPKVKPDKPSQGYKYNFGYNVNLNGELYIHVVPTIELGISVLGGSLIDANAYVAADLHAGVEITGSVSHTQAPNFCINPHYGLALSGGVTGSLLYWEASPLKLDFYHVDYTFASKCFDSVTEPSASNTFNARATDLPRSHMRRHKALRAPRTLEASAGTLPKLAPPAGARIVVSEEDSNQLKRREIHPVSHSYNTPSVSSLLPRPPKISKRALVPPIIASDFLCPQVDSQIGAKNSDNQIYSDAEPLSNNDDGVYRREELGYVSKPISTGNMSHLHQLLPQVQVATCGGDIKFDGNAYTNTQPSGYWNLADPEVLDPDLKAYSQPVGLVAGANVYGREHVYELQLLTQWIDTLATEPDIFQNAAKNVDFCTWAVANFKKPSKYAAVTSRINGVNTVTERLRRCEPSNTLSILTNGNSMRWLESTANTMKAAAFGGKDIKTKSTFDGYGFSKKVFEIRAAAGVFSYLQSGPVADEFVNVHSCVLQVWKDWYSGYLADTATDAPNKANFNVPVEYRTWIKGKVSSTGSALITGITNMITWYGQAAGGNNVRKDVELDYGDLEDDVPLDDVSANDLTTNILTPRRGAGLTAIGSRL